MMVVGEGAEHITGSLEEGKYSVHTEAWVNEYHTFFPFHFWSTDPHEEPQKLGHKDCAVRHGRGSLAWKYIS